MEKNTIYILNGGDIPAEDLRIHLHRLGYEVRTERDESLSLSLAQGGSADLLIVGCKETDPDHDFQMVKRIRESDRRVPIVIVSTNGSKAHAIAAFRAGASDYLDFPCSREKLRERIQANLSQTKDLSGQRHASKPMVGNSRAMREINHFIQRVAAADSTVLITGETGTGKELVASRIHAQSGRRTQPFVCVNCAALPDALVESEMFGYERGAFTGAVSARSGKFEVANGGTIFLDEISDMTPFAQAKLLRTIESKELYRLGGRKVIPLDVRVTAATNKDPEELISEGKFREDLYYRLNIARIHLPPLRDRKEDLRRLIASGIEKLNQKYGRNVQGLSAEAMVFFMRYDWPGNVRELLNLLEAAFINLPQKEIEFADLPGLFQQKLKETANVPMEERRHILSALLETKWNKAEAARKLHWSRMTLYRKITKYRIAEQKSPPR
jgi:DNA-binding NtrC family response regulator